MASEDAECYSVDRFGYAYGPYSSETKARAIKDPNETVMWLSYTDIDEYGYVRNWNE